MLRRVHAIGGMDAVLKLSQSIGGKRIFIPKKPVAAGHPLAVAGDKVAAMLVDEFGGSHTDIPKGRAQIRLLIAHDVVEKGGSNNQIAEAADVTRARAKQLRRMVRKGKTPAPAGRPRARADSQLDIEEFLRRK